ncbi:MAG: hypothetical protein ACXACP_06935 [Candidatus Hodarchaeales archaeon]|jgi:hypothetical protein
MQEFNLVPEMNLNSDSFTYTPGQRVIFKAKFSQIPERYRLQILDGNKNSRFNQYGKGSSLGINFSWPIPKMMKSRHLGLWQISINTASEIFRCYFEVKSNKQYFNLMSE